MRDDEVRLARECGELVPLLASGIRAVYLDAVGTLLHPEPPAPVVYAVVAKRYGSILPLETIRARFRAACAAEEAVDRAGDQRTSEEREVLRWRQIVAKVLGDVTDPETCFQDLFQHFSRPEAWACDAQAGPVLERLASRGYLLGMASNFDHRLRLVVAGKPELRPITRLVISSEVGWRKPAPELFAALASDAGVGADSILFVGDDPANDYHGAARAGLQPVLLDRDGRHRGTVPRRIEELMELAAD
jgi:putative hydrolase of the HAD superfamily